MYKVLLIIDGLMSVYTMLCILATINVVRKKKDKDLLESCYGYFALNAVPFMVVTCRIMDHFRVYETSYLNIFAFLFYVIALYVIIKAFNSFSKQTHR